MSTPSKKIMVINRYPWHKDLECPTYTGVGTAIKEVLEKSPVFDVIVDDLISEKKEPFSYTPEDVTGLIHITQVSLDSIDKEDHRRLDKEKFIRFFLKKPLIEDSPPQNLQLLMLFHRYDGMGTVSEYLKLRNSLTTSQSQENCEKQTSFPYQENQIQFGMFGGGQGAMYDEKGLLSHVGETFQLALEYEGAAKFDEEKKRKPLAIRQSHFEFVWNHYWFQTRKKIEKLRDNLFRVQIPVKMGPDNDNIQQTQNLVKNFLYYFIKSCKKEEKQLDIQLSQFYKQIMATGTSKMIKSDLDFSACEDLTYWIKIEDSNSINLIHSLCQFAEGKLESYKQLNVQFEDLLHSMNSNRG